MTETAMTEAQLMECIRKLQDPEIGRSLGDLGMVSEVKLGDGNAVLVKIELPTPAYPGRERIVDAVKQAIASGFPHAGAVNVEFTWVVKGKETGGAIGLRVKNVLAVGSGKGGVGKSTVAASLAYGLHLCGASVGLMDADVYGPSIPHMLGVNRRPEISEQRNANGEVVQRIEPIETDGLKLMSIGFLGEMLAAFLVRDADTYSIAEHTSPIRAPSISPSAQASDLP